MQRAWHLSQRVPPKTGTHQVYMYEPFFKRAIIIKGV